ncbi:MAG: methionyl-tRNA formyltransferase [Phycisphaerae bacterium]|nr:methionyl-tRNA formyltransferase [Phycisphaerae bacterium]
MKIVFFGSDDFALPTLDALVRSAGGHSVVGIVSQPDRPAGRGRHLHPTPVSLFAREHAIPLMCPTSVNKDEPKAMLAQWGGDIGVVIAFGQKIGNDVLAMFRHGCVNLHASLLPKYRGAAPVVRAILSGDSVTGVTIFRLVERMDAGPMAFQAPTAIEPAETAGELRERLAQMGPAAMIHTLDLIEHGRAQFVFQDDLLASPAPKLAKADGILDWNQSAIVIANRIRGLYPWPGVHARFLPASRAGRAEEVVLARAVPEAVSARSQAGAEVGVLREDMLVSAGLGAVRLIEVKPAGSRLMSFTDFVNGRRVRPGDRFIAPQLPSLPLGRHA